MRVVAPHDLTGYTSTVPEDDAPQWDTATTYAASDKVIRHHYIYTSREGGNKGNDPALTSSGTGLKWEKGAVSNQWAMFDGIINTQTVVPGEEITVTLPFRRATGFAAFRMDCTGLTARAYDVDAAVPFWTRTYDLGRDRRSRWSYRYEEASWVRDLTETQIGIAPRGRLDLTFTRTGGNCAVGSVFVGRAFDVGETQFDAEPSLKSYSAVTESFDGGMTFIPRYSVKNLRATVRVHPRDLDRVYEYLKGLLNRPAVWIGDNGDLMPLECLTTYGYLRAVSAPISTHDTALLPIEVMGMI